MEEIRRRDAMKNDKSVKGLLKMLLGTYIPTLEEAHFDTSRKMKEVE